MGENEERDEEYIKKALKRVETVDNGFPIPVENIMSKVVKEFYSNRGDVRDIMSLMIEQFPIEELKRITQLESEQESKSKKNDLETFKDFCESIKELNQNIVRINSNIEKTKLLNDIILDPSKNTVDVLWDELEYFMKGDKDYKIEKIERDKITIKALRKEAFLNTFIMAKIFGRILPYDCKFILNIKNYRGKDVKEDLLIYEFLILAESNFYKGSVFIKFQED